MNRAARLLGTILLGLTVAALAAVVAGRAASWTAAPVLTGSMTPTFPAGSLVITRPVPASQLRPGQVPLFVPPGESALYAHRIVAISGEPSSPVLRTKGDANTAPDPWRARITTPTVPVVVLHLPAIGRLGVLLHGPSSQALLVALLGLFLTGTSVRLVLTAPSPAPAAS
ncbi:MAG: peptidase signal peptidase [Frankiales bacterium]|jgi:signal peptidase I|nr:peptidase signal peptidase [Frankiales bacterium]